MDHAQKINLGILGGTGKMGKLAQELIASHYSNRINLGSALNSKSSLEPLADCDVLLDVSHPTQVIKWIEFSKNFSKKPALIVGSTGWSEKELQTLKVYSKNSATLYSSNFSIGVFLLCKILKHFSSELIHYGYTPVLTESHHQFKKDAPSGTALTLRECINPKAPEKIQTHSIRAGNVVGEHEVKFYGPLDEITFHHSAKNRSVFVQGALEACLWIRNQRPGFYTMENFYEGRSS